LAGEEMPAHIPQANQRVCSRSGQNETVIGVNLAEFGSATAQIVFGKIWTLVGRNHNCTGVGHKALPMKHFKPILRAFAIALLATASFEGVSRFVLIPLFGFSPKILISILAVISAAWFGHLKAGLIATILNGCLLWDFLSEDADLGLTLHRQIRLLVFLFIGGIISWGSEALHTARQRAELRQRELEEEVQRRKRAEADLREREERFRTLAMFAPVGIFQTDAEGAGLFANEAWCTITGARPEQALGNGWARFVHPEDRQRVFEGWQDAARNRRNEVTEFRFVNQATGIRWVVASTSAIADAAGGVTGYVGTVVDLTDRKAVEDIVREDEARLRSILDNTPAAISLKDLQGRYVLVNRNWEELFGVSNDQIVGLKNEDLLSLTASPHMSKEIADQFMEIDRIVVEAGEPIEFEDPVQYGDVPQFYLTVKFPIRDANSRITGIGGISIDVTERRQAVDALAAEQDLLRHTIEVQDHERQIIAYDIHDGLIQYITGALMQLEAIQSSQLSPVADQLEGIVAVLRRAVAEGRRLMGGIRTPVLDGLGAVAAIGNLIEEGERAHVQVEFIKDDALGRMDPKIEEAIYRIAQEALTNIEKHSESTNVRVELKRQGDKVFLEVRDWGVGFTPSKQVGGAVHGLRGMMERARIAGGQCTISSVPGDGTRVAVEVPYTSRS
jgi:PAS domain S-box-containing protein